MNSQAVIPLKRAELVHDGLFKHDLEVSRASSLVGAGAALVCP